MLSQNQRINQKHQNDVSCGIMNMEASPELDCVFIQKDYFRIANHQCARRMLSVAHIMFRFYREKRFSRITSQVIMARKKPNKIILV